MGKPTARFIDPVNGNDTTGDGLAHGTAWATVQHALDNTTRDATNGNIFHINSSGDDTSSAPLDFTTFNSGGGSAGAPVIFEGYASTAGDGDFEAGTGIGGISGGGSNSIFSSTGLSYIWMRHLHLHNCGSAAIINLDNQIRIFECELDNTSGNGIDVDNGSSIEGCHIHNVGGQGIRLFNATNAVAKYNFLANGTNDFSDAIATGNQHNRVEGNIISVDGTSNGIALQGINDRCENNTVYSSSTSGVGIRIVANADIDAGIINNYVEGFDDGIDTAAITSNSVPILAHNAVYNANTNDYDDTGEAIGFEDDNESLGSSGIAKSGSATDFGNRETYFAPADVGNMRGGAFPPALRRDKGAVQHADPAGGGGSTAYVIGS